MLLLTVPATRVWDEAKEEFVQFQGESLLLEHSLVSLSKWEESTEKPFLVKEEHTIEETIEYIKFMTISPVNNPFVYELLTQEHFDQISAYIDKKMTATWFRETKQQRPSTEAITAEILYYYMIALNIPMECQYWHLNKLLTLIKVTNLKNAPEEKKGRRTNIADRRAAAAAARARYNTKG
jgi:hypothetical protein